MTLLLALPFCLTRRNTFMTTAARKTTITNPDGGTVPTVADAYGMPLTVTDPLGHVTTNTYDANHNLLTTTDPLGNTRTYGFDANGFRTSFKDPLGKVWSATYNAVAGPTVVTNPLNQTQGANYDANLRPCEGRNGERNHIWLRRKGSAHLDDSMTDAKNRVTTSPQVWRLCNVPLRDTGRLCEDRLSSSSSMNLAAFGRALRRGRATGPRTSQTDAAARCLLSAIVARASSNFEVMAPQEHGFRNCSLNFS